MSTHWDLQCRDCGAGTNWSQNIYTKNAGPYLVPICKNGILGKLIEIAHDFKDAFASDGYMMWRVNVRVDCSDLTVDLAEAFSRECAHHRIWPMDEYGRWLSAVHYLSPLDAKTTKLLEGGPGADECCGDGGNNP